MWDRSILKSNAKVALGGRYWTAFLVTLLFTVLSEWLNAVNGNFRRLAEIRVWHNGTGHLFSWFPFGGAGGWLSLFYIAFVVHPLLIGVARYFVRNHFESARVETLFSGFQWNYGNGVGVLFLTRLFIFLWSLLLVIPGVVKLVQYSMVPFLLSDNPSLPGERAREISRMMTDGQKGAIFVFWLSFLGWFLLGALCFGVGTFFVLPYFSASQAELYLLLRERALSLGFVRPEELCLTQPFSRP
jgi:uncharacterized membrane protein